MAEFPSKKEVRTAVIGLGGIGALHASILASIPGCKLVAVADREKRLIQIASRLISSIHFYSDVKELISSERPDAVYVCTPADTHLAVVKEILSVGQGPRGIFIEKPLATNVKDADEISEITRRHNVITGVGFQRRFFPTMRKAKQMLLSGEIGEPLLVRAHHFAESILEEGDGWRFRAESGGVTLDLGVHLLDVLMYFFGDLKIVDARMLKVYSKDCEDYVYAQLRNEQVPMILFEVGWSMWGFNPSDFRIEIQGTNGGLEVTPDYVNKFSREGSEGSSVRTVTFTSIELAPKLPVLIGSVENVLIDQDYITKISTDSEPEVTINDGVKINLIADSIRKLASRVML